MPIKSERQRRLMEAARHNPEFAKKVGISKAVAEKFVGPKAHNDGGAVKESEMKKPMPPKMPMPPAKAKGKKELPPFMKKDAKAKPKKMAYGGKAC